MVNLYFKVKFNGGKCTNDKMMTFFVPSFLTRPLHATPTQPLAPPMGPFLKSYSRY